MASDLQLQTLSLSAMEELTFKEYLHKKKIDAIAFAKARSEEYAALKKEFDQLHPDSFTAQKLFIINPIRREFPFKADAEVKKQKKLQPRPKIIRPKTS